MQIVENFPLTFQVMFIHYVRHFFFWGGLPEINQITSGRPHSVLLCFFRVQPRILRLSVSFSEMVQVGFPPKTTTSRGKTNSRTLHLPDCLLEEDTFFLGSPGNPEIIKEYLQSEICQRQEETHRNDGAKFGSLITHNLASGKR